MNERTHTHKTNPEIIPIIEQTKPFSKSYRMCLYIYVHTFEHMPYVQELRWRKGRYNKDSNQSSREKIYESVIPGMKNTLDRINSILDTAREMINLNTQKQKLPKINQREN